MGKESQIFSDKEQLENIILQLDGIMKNGLHLNEISSPFLKEEKILATSLYERVNDRFGEGIKVKEDVLGRIYDFSMILGASATSRWINVRVKTPVDKDLIDSYWPESYFSKTLAYEKGKKVLIRKEDDYIEALRFNTNNGGRVISVSRKALSGTGTMDYDILYKLSSLYERSIENSQTIDVNVGKKSVDRWNFKKSEFVSEEFRDKNINEVLRDYKGGGKYVGELIQNYRGNKDQSLYQSTRLLVEAFAKSVTITDEGLVFESGPYAGSPLRDIIMIPKGKERKEDLQAKTYIWNLRQALDFSGIRNEDIFYSHICSEIDRMIGEKR